MTDAAKVDQPVEPSKKYRDATSLTKWVKGMLYFTSATSAAAAISAILRYQLLAKLSSGAFMSDDLAQAAIDSNNQRETIITTIGFVAFIVTLILFFIWIYRANENVRSLGAQGLKFTPGWSVGWYFIPIFNLWKPYQAMKEIYKASMSPMKWPFQERSGMLPWWWVLWLLSWVAVWSDAGEVIGYMIDIAAALVTARLVAQIYELQVVQVRVNGSIQAVS